jgi:hypothetical protein
MQTTEYLFSKIKELEQRLTDQEAQYLTKMNELEQRLEATLPKSAAQPSSDAATSRRKMLKRLGWSAAGLMAATTAAIVTSETNNTAQAASGDLILAGNSNLASDTTYFSQVSSANPSDGAIIWGDWNSSSKSAAPNAKAGVAGTSQGGVGGYFQGSLAPLLLVPATSGTGQPSGTHSAGELYIDSQGSLFLCKTGGTPGTWVQLNGSGGGGSGTYVTLKPNLTATPDNGNILLSGTISLVNADGVSIQLSYDPLNECGTLYALYDDGSSASLELEGDPLYLGADVEVFGSMAVDCDLDVNGTLTKSSGSFVIPHPDPAKTATHDLRHCFVEAPSRGENLYRFVITAKTDNEVVKMSLPAYWPFLNENPQVWVTGKGHLGQAYGEVDDKLTTLSVICEKAGDYNILLIGTRKDEIARAWWDEYGVEKPIAKTWTSPDPRLTSSPDRTKEVVRMIKNKKSDKKHHSKKP